MALILIESASEQQWCWEGGGEQAGALVGEGIEGAVGKGVGACGGEQAGALVGYQRSSFTAPPEFLSQGASTSLSLPVRGETNNTEHR